MLYIFASGPPDNLAEFIRVPKPHGAHSLENVRKLVRSKEPRIHLIDVKMDEMQNLHADLSAHGYIVKMRPTSSSHAEFFLERQG